MELSNETQILLAVVLALIGMMGALLVLIFKGKKPQQPPTVYLQCSAHPVMESQLNSIALKVSNLETKTEGLSTHMIRAEGKIESFSDKLDTIINSLSILRRGR